MVWGSLKSITFIVHFISIITQSAPPQNIRHQILRWGTPGLGVYYDCHSVDQETEDRRQSTAEAAGRIRPSAHGMLSTTHRSVQQPPPRPSHILHPLHLPPASCPWSPAPRSVQPSPGPTPGSAPSQCQLPELSHPLGQSQMLGRCKFTFTQHQKSEKKKKKFSLAIRLKKYVIQKI